MLQSSNAHDMRSYQCTVAISSPARKVYEALTTPQGLQGWWTATCEVATDLGAESTFHFGQTCNIMRIERLVPGSEVRWRCVHQYHHAPGELTHPDEWINTLLVFRLFAPTLASTLLDFEHVGLMPGLDCYEICERGWDHFLKHSLKNYVEIGQGDPYRETAA